MQVPALMHGLHGLHALEVLPWEPVLHKQLPPKDGTEASRDATMAVGLTGIQRSRNFKSKHMEHQDRETEN